jgi:CBS domain-containing protein
VGQIREVMTENPTTCEPSSTIVDCAKVMAKEDVGPIPIVEGNRVVGLVTDRDIVVRAVAEGRDVKQTTVGDIASTNLITVSADDDFSRALELMAQHQVRRLPVVEGDRLVGIIAQADVARAAEEEQTGEVVQQISK